MVIWHYSCSITVSINSPRTSDKGIQVDVDNNNNQPVTTSKVDPNCCSTRNATKPILPLDHTQVHCQPVPQTRPRPKQQQGIFPLEQISQLKPTVECKGDALNCADISENRQSLQGQTAGKAGCVIPSDKQNNRSGYYDQVLRIWGDWNSSTPCSGRR